MSLKSGQIENKRIKIECAKFDFNVYLLHRVEREFCKTHQASQIMEIILKTLSNISIVLNVISKFHFLKIRICIFSYIQTLGTLYNIQQRMNINFYMNYWHRILDFINEEHFIFLYVLRFFTHDDPRHQKVFNTLIAFTLGKFRAQFSAHCASVALETKINIILN